MLDKLIDAKILHFDYDDDSDILYSITVVKDNEVYSVVAEDVDSLLIMQGLPL